MPNIKTIIIKDDEMLKMFRIGKDRDGSYYAERRGDLIDCDVKIILDNREQIIIPGRR
ncbi:MAG: hypothetical protein WC092_08290 [Anaerovoracaceae bacterium]